MPQIQKNIYQIVISRRTVRQFDSRRVPGDLLKKMINAARLAPSAANLQPLEFIVISNQEICQEIFPCLKWAAYIAPDGNPKPGYEPPAYIVTLVNTNVREKGFEWDAGAAIENMILTAWAEGVASCWLLSVERKKVREVLKIPPNYIIDSVLALGYPAEEPAAEDAGDSIKYYKDEKGRLHVPKRPLEKVMHTDVFNDRR
ncbi:MAG: nitroreductase family protein [Candidatus Aminicenantes bacterium]